MARHALKRESQIQFLTTLCLINAIISTGNNVAAAVSGGDAPVGDTLKKTTDQLRDLLLPELAESRDEAAARIKDELEKEMNRGPLKVRFMDRDPKKKGHVRLRRK